MSTVGHHPGTSLPGAGPARPAHAWPTTPAGWAALDDCPRCGLAMLNLFSRSATWVRRRVEHVAFLDDRTVRRRMSVDYVSPSADEAVSFERADGAVVRVLPLTMMRRKSLVKFDLRDEHGTPLPLLGLREAQALTLAVMRAWASAALLGDRPGPLPALPASVSGFVRDIVAGDQQELHGAYARFDAARTAEEPADEGAALLRRLARDPVFKSLVDRFAGGFLLFTLDMSPPGARRIVKFAYDEPLTLRHSTSSYQGHAQGRFPGRPAPRRDPEPLTYGRGGRRLPWWYWRPLTAALGWRPTVIRFPVPAAELAASYHLEVTAPPEVSVIEASMLAGRPNLTLSPSNDPDEDRAAWQALEDEDPDDRVRWRRRPSFDTVTGGYPTVDLHIADVPFGSLSRAQVKLQADTKGWLATAVVTTWLTTGILGFLAATSPLDGELGSTVLLTFAGAVAALLARRDPHGMTTRLLSGVRNWATLPAVLMLAAVLALIGLTDERAERALQIVGALSVLPAIVVTMTWLRSRHALRGRALIRRLRNKTWARTSGARLADREPELLRLSPWEQHPPGDRPDAGASSSFHVELATELTDSDFPFDAAVHELGFDAAAIKVASAEGGRSEFVWNDAFQAEYDARLRRALERCSHRAARFSADR